MADKQGKGRRRLPQWYLDKVNLAAEAFSGSPDYVDKRRPWVPHRAPMGQGVGAQRVGKMPSKHRQPGLDLAGQGHGLDLLE